MASSAPTALARRQTALRLVQDDGGTLNRPDCREFLDDPEIVRAAVAHTGNALKFASDRLKDDPETVLMAVSPPPSPSP